MPLNQHETKLLNSQILQDEKLELAVKQNLLRFTLAPTIIAVTDQRVIIIKHSVFELTMNTDMLYFKDIASVQVLKHIFLSSVFMRILGTDTKDKREGIIDGLSHSDAKIIGDILSKHKISSGDKEEF